jgi:hypothetical protein
VNKLGAASCSLEFVVGDCVVSCGVLSWSAE